MEKDFKYPQSASGFTLIELMVVIAIIGLLASTVLNSLTSARMNARDTARLTEAREMMKALEIYRTTNGRYPCSGVGGGPFVINCAPGTVSGASLAILKAGGSDYNSVSQQLRSSMSFSPDPDSVGENSIFYAARSTSATYTVDPSSYTLIIGAENIPGLTTVPTNSLLKVCKITTGAADVFGKVGGVSFVNIADCAIKGVN